MAKEHEAKSSPILASLWADQTLVTVLQIICKPVYR